MRHGEPLGEFQRPLANRFEFANKLVSQIEHLVPDDYPFGDRGAVIGVVLDIKPAVPIKLTSLELLEQFLHQHGSNLEIIGGFLVNKHVLLERLKKDEGVAKEFGWDFDKSLEENISHLTVNEAEDNQFRKLTGFILGYPEQAIRDFDRLRTIESQGVPDIHRFFFTSDPETRRALKVDVWDEGDRSFLDSIEKLYDEAVNGVPARSYKEARQLLSTLPERAVQEHRDAFRLVYQKYFHLDDETIDHILNMRHVNIDSPEGDPVYAFRASINGEEPKEIRDLRQHVQDAFRK